MGDETPKTIGKYDILRELGRGGQGSVYLAVDPNLPSHRVILKVFKLNSPNDAERCRREADKLAQLESSPGFAGIKDFFPHGADWVLVMPFLEGRSLADRVRDDGPVPVEEAIRITVLLLRALQTAHEKGIYHRDIKPGNVMLLRGNEVKLIDFGLAKSVTDPDITDTRMFMGSARYMAPEQFPPIPPNIDYRRVDIYQLGVTLFNMLTANHPYDEGPQDLWELIQAKRTQEPIPPSARLDGLPPELERIVLKAIARDPAQRYASAAEMLEELGELTRPDGTRIVEGHFEPHRYPPVSPAPPAPPAAPFPPAGAGVPGGPSRRAAGRASAGRGVVRRRRWPLLAGGLAVTVAAVALLVLLSPDRERKEPSPSKLPTTADLPVVTQDAEQVTAVGGPDTTATPTGGTTPAGTVERPRPRPTRPVESTAMPAPIPSSPSPTPTTRGSLNVVSLPDRADIYLDNEYQGQTNRILEDLTPGNHHLRVSLEIGGEVKSLERIVRVVAGRTERVRFEFASP